MLILLTNDDGICAPGLVALARQLRSLGEVYIVAPSSEQSGVGHSITYLTPIIVKEVYSGARQWGWAVDGTPADCVKLGISEFCPRRPDLIVSGINGGLNAGINVLYSGTMAAAIEGAFFGIRSVAVSLQWEEMAQFDKAAQIAVSVIGQILEQKTDQTRLFNLNIPTAALDQKPDIAVVPMDVKQYWEKMERRADPAGRTYYWVTGGPTPLPHTAETDITALAKGNVSLTPLDFNMTHHAALDEMGGWSFDVPRPGGTLSSGEKQGPDIRYARIRVDVEDPTARGDQ